MKQLFNKIKQLFNMSNYKVYTAFITQSNTDDPVAVELDNTIGDIFLMREAGVGEYRIVSDSLFIKGKTTIDVSPLDVNSNQYGFAMTDYTQNNMDVLKIFTFAVIDGQPIKCDNMLKSTKIEIKVKI